MDNQTIEKNNFAKIMVLVDVSLCIFGYSRSIYTMEQVVVLDDKSCYMGNQMLSECL